MTRAVQDRILKDANGDISDHLRNHIHLTNCIHLKNHMHKHSPMLNDRSLMRDLVALQRSRSLRDPSASPRNERRTSKIHNQSPQNDENRDELSQGTTLTKSEQKGRGNRAKTLSQQLNEVPKDLPKDQPEPSGRVSCSGLNRARRRKFRKMKRTKGNNAPTMEPTALNEASVDSNSSVRAVGHQAYQTEEQEEECGENNVARIPKNGCGIPWNWSKIHHRGKSFLSCGLSDPRSKRGGSMSQGRDFEDFPKASDGSCSCSQSDGEALPLLVDGSGSQATSQNAGWEHDYSGELGIFADSLLNNEADSDLDLRRDNRGLHQSLTQKYMPKTFRDLVGQNLVVQALSNAVMQRKVGLLYVFYGPHGTGKTSCARILARALNCRSAEHPKPCGCCSSCIAHDQGKSRSIKEVGSVSNFDFESIMDLLESMMLSQKGSPYRVFIFDDCDTLSADCWSAMSKVIDRAPRRVVFMLICSSLDILPHVIISRCQKFYFPKLKDADIIYALQWIATKEGLEIDKDALRLIASRSDGSLRDAEMTLEQLSLLGQRISVTLVQELVGLISDEKLVDLLDLALSADTVNTVKSLREIMETGVEPLALMSQLATVITDILAGSYDFLKEKRRRRFFRRSPLAKEDMEKLRQALKTLSEAEKQLRMSNDKLTWLTAALLQLAPDRQYMLPVASTDTSFSQSPLASNAKSGREAARRSNVSSTVMSHRRSLDSRIERLHVRSSADVHDATRSNARSVDRRKHVDIEIGDGRRSFSKNRAEIDEIWSDALDKIRIDRIKEFLYQEGKLMSVSHTAAPVVQLVFSSHQTRSKAEQLRGYIQQAFESTFGRPVLVEMRTEPRKGVASEAGSSQKNMKSQSTANNRFGVGTSEIVEVGNAPSEANKRSLVVAQGGEEMASQSERRRLNQCQSIVKGKVSLASVIQQAEGCAKPGSWTKRKAVSIAEKLEQENLRLEPKTRSLLCWNASRATSRKFSRLRIRTRRTRSLLKLVSCGKCLSSRSPR